MRKAVPIIGDFSWRFALAPVCALLFAVGFFSMGLGRFAGVIVGVAVFALYTAAAHLFTAGAHHRGLRMLERGRYEEALAAFTSSLATFKSHPMVDHYRCLSLMSTSTMSYAEMAAANIGLSHAMLGDVIRARIAYRECLALNPDNAAAQALLKALDAPAQEKPADKPVEK